LAAPVKRDAAHRLDLRPRCGVTHDGGENRLGRLYRSKGANGRNVLLYVKPGTFANLKRRPRLAIMLSCQSTTMFAVASAAGGKFLFTACCEHIWVDQRKAEHCHQQRCPDAMHWNQVYSELGAVSNRILVNTAGPAKAGKAHSRHNAAR